MLFLSVFLSQALKNQFEPHNYTYGWKAVLDGKILVPRLRGLEAVINALDFFNALGRK